MTPDLSISERLASIATALREPFARDHAGDLTVIGHGKVDGLKAILEELPLIRAESADDALALASIARDMLDVLALNAEANPLGTEAVVVLAQSLNGLKDCLSALAGRPASDFNVGGDPTSAPIQ